ncbi:MAG: NAD(P)H-hydrate dehydratase [Bradyrhizobiaceae bacterium]|nr:NAD(P)H-hydrate dehydratase [Bradyrhizobiaceae bacterium]
MFELLTPDEMARADRQTIAEGMPGIELMERAGRAVAERTALWCPPGSRVAVVCGPGNNGGDGFVAARVLHERGYRVRLMLFGSREKLRGDAAEAARAWAGEVETFTPEALAHTDVVIDALFGAGLARDLDGDAKAAVDAMNAAGKPAIAVDLPSGIDGATGQVRGAAVRAAETVIFCRRKPGHLLLPGRLHCGEIYVADIGIKDETVRAVSPQTFANEPPLWLAHFPVPRADGHKYDRGHAVVVSGPMHATGAARLAARAALRTGAGLVTVAAPKAAVPVLGASLTAVMVREANGAKGLAKLLGDKRLNAVLLGPGQGVGKATKDAVAAAAKARRALVLDADALTSFAGAAKALSKILAAVPAAVLTPHDGEFARLFSAQPAVVRAASKVERARAAARQIGKAVLLKGPDTVVAGPDGRAAIASNAPPWLATAGSGDVLAGVVTGLLAQGMPAFEAACAAVWLHGEAGKEAGPGMTSEDLDPALRLVLQRLIRKRLEARKA